MQLAYRARSDIGLVRSVNEDCYAIGDGPADAAPGSLFVVCDGRGGPNAGELAARMAADLIVATYYASNERDPEQALIGAFEAANQQVYHQWSRSATWVTAVAALLLAEQLTIASVGDCRAYHFRDRRLRRITHDHTFHEELVREGMLTREEVQKYVSHITQRRAIGESVELEVDVFHEVLQQDDALLLCTDGLHGYLEDSEIEETLVATPMEEVVDRFIDLVNARGGRDNVTVILIWREEERMRDEG